MQDLKPKEKLGQKILVRAINEFVRRDLLALNPDQVDESDLDVEISILGIPAVAHAGHIGSDEVSVTVILWPSGEWRQLISSPANTSKQRRRLGDFYARGWLERRDGVQLQTSSGLPFVSCAKHREDEVEMIPWEDPVMFKAHGTFFR